MVRFGVGGSGWDREGLGYIYKGEEVEVEEDTRDLDFRVVG